MTSLAGAPARQVRPLIRTIVVALVAALACACAGPAHGAETGPIAAVRIERSSPSVPTDGDLAFLVATDVRPPVPYFEVRVKVSYPSGKLLYQRTRVFSDVGSATVRADFGRTLSDLSLEEGRYPLEVRVRTGDERRVLTGEYVLEDRFLVFDASKPPTPLVPVIRLAQAPSLDAEGRFVDDPGAADQSLRTIERFAEILSTRADLRLSAAIPPALVEQWERVAEGYETVGPAGVATVGEDSATAERHRQGLATLSEAAATERLELLDVPYADPDLAGLASVDAAADLGTHYARGTSVLARALQATPSAGGTFARGILPADGAASVDAEGISYAVLAPQSFTGPRGLAGGAWRVRDTSLTALVADTRLSDGAADPEATSTVALDRLFDLRAALGPATPITFVCEFGPGRAADPDVFERFLTEATAGGWARTVTAGEAATSTASGTLALADEPRKPSAAPEGYWREIVDSRAKTLALLEAAGEADDDADAAVWRLLMAESNGWSGPDDAWSLADRGRGFAAAAARTADSVFESVRLDVSDITLSGTSGKIPVVIANDSGKTLALELVAASESLDVVNAAQELSVSPAENYATISVDLAGGISAPLDVSLEADGFEVASHTVTVRASVLDRLVIVAGVAIVLVGLLFYIRRRTRAAGVSENGDVGRIDSGSDDARSDRRPAPSQEDRP